MSGGIGTTDSKRRKGSLVKIQHCPRNSEKDLVIESLNHFFISNESMAQ